LPALPQRTHPAVLAVRVLVRLAIAAAAAEDIIAIARVLESALALILAAWAGAERKPIHLLSRSSHHLIRREVKGRKPRNQPVNWLRATPLPTLS